MMELESSNKPTKEKPNKKRTTGEIRAEMKLQGCIFLQFDPPANTNQKWINEWRAMEKYGLFVTTEGCILPYKYYRKTAKAGDKLKGHKRAVHFFMNVEPDRQPRVNQFGWPCEEQISHLCHNPDCANPLHLQVEYKWRNWKRTYCGYNGHCDCGMQPPCVRTYTNPETFAQSCTIESDIPKVKVILADLKQRWNFKVLQKHHYDVTDEHAAARNKRKSREKKHREEKERKTAKKTAKQESEASEIVLDSKQ